MQNAATLGVSLDVLGPLWGPLWPWVRILPFLDSDDVDENKKPLHMRVFLWEARILAS